MRVTIIPSDNFVSVDGVGFNGINLAFIAANIHAIQWYGDHGVVEIKDITTNRIVSNEDISDFTSFQSAINGWQEAKAAYEAQKAIEEAQAAELQRLIAENEARVLADPPPEVTE